MWNVFRHHMILRIITYQYMYKKYIHGPTRFTIVLKTLYCRNIVIYWSEALWYWLNMEHITSSIITFEDCDGLLYRAGNRTPGSWFITCGLDPCMVWRDVFSFLIYIHMYIYIMIIDHWYNIRTSGKGTGKSKEMNGMLFNAVHDKVPSWRQFFF